MFIFHYLFAITIRVLTKHMNFPINMVIRTFFWLNNWSSSDTYNEFTYYE